jgi:hypothetical protein
MSHFVGLLVPTGDFAVLASRVYLCVNHSQSEHTRRHDRPLSSSRKVGDGPSRKEFMAHKHTQAEIDSVINKWRGKHAVEKMVAEYDGSKWSRHQRFRLEGGTIFHIATDTLKLTITPAKFKGTTKAG